MAVKIFGKWHEVSDLQEASDLVAAASAKASMGKWLRYSDNGKVADMGKVIGRISADGDAYIQSDMAERE